MLPKHISHDMQIQTQINASMYFRLDQLMCFFETYFLYFRQRQLCKKTIEYKKVLMRQKNVLV